MNPYLSCVNYYLFYYFTAWSVPQLADYIEKTHSGLRGFTRPNCLAWGNCTKSIRMTKLSHQWRDNCPGLTISSFLVKVKIDKSVNFIYRMS